MSYLSGKRVFLSLLSVWLCSLGLGAPFVMGARRAVSPAQRSAGRPQPSALGCLPFYFVENGGQFGEGVRFEGRTPRRRVSLTRDGIIYGFGGGGAPARGPEVFRAVYEGARNDVSIAGAAALESRANYFIGSDPSKWITGARTYGKVVYRGIYPGVDLHVAGDDRALKCEYRVAAGGDARDIRWTYSTGRSAVLNDKGQLEVRGERGVLIEDIPRSYQTIDGRAVPVKTSYAIGPGGRIGFEVGTYDHARELVIDPDLLYSSFLGGGGADAAYAVAVDGNGSAYVTGSTASANFPTTAGALDPTADGLGDVFVTKFNAAGTGLVYSTYIGGGGADAAHGIAVDSDGNAVITGSTESANFPTTTGAYNRVKGGGSDVFVLKLNSAGNALVYSTFLGGAAADSGAGVALDGSGNAFVTGATASSNFPVTAGAYDQTYNGTPYQDAFLTKLSASGASLVYSTYLGGNQDDAGSAVAIDGGQNAYVTGFTESTNFPTTAGAFDRTKGLYQDVFVTKLNPGGTALVYSTFIGGNLNDTGNALAVDSGGSAYIAGATQSSDYPTTAGAHDRSFNGLLDAFVTKLNAAGSTLSFSTFLGGAGSDSAAAIAASDTGIVCVIGRTESSDFPTTPDAYSRGLQGSADAFITKLNSAGSLVTYSTFFGGTASDSGAGVAADRAGNIYVVGYTDSSDYPTTAGAYDRTYNTNQDAFLFSMSAGLTSLPLPKHAVGDFDGDGTNEIAVDFGAAGVSVWDSGTWTLISPDNPDTMVAGNFAGLTHDQLAADFGALGLKVWSGSTWSLISSKNAQRMIVAETDGDGQQELVVDFDGLGLWLWNSGSWSQLSGADAGAMIAADLNGNGNDEIVAAFIGMGLWQWTGGVWTQLSGADADFLIAGDVDGNGLPEVVGDFGALGMWMMNSTGWTEVSSADADFMVAADINGNGTDEVLASFGALGTWQGTIYVWTELSPADGSDMAKANLDGNNYREVAVDFGPLGLWVRSGSQWSQLSSQNPESITVGDLDADGADELVVDFGSLGLWLWNGSWTRMSALNAD